MNSEEFDGVWDTYRAADYLGCAPGTLRNWTSKRRVPYRKVGRLTRFLKRDLDDWLEGCRVEAIDQS